MNKIDVTSCTVEELAALMTELGERPFRAKQLFQWLHQKNIVDFDGMTTLSLPLRQKLKEKTTISQFKILEKYSASVDNTTKYLFQTGNDYIIESVFMRYGYGNTACLSTQAGCRMGCAFCASAVGGLERNLTAGEIAAQVYAIAKESGERVSRIVLMGCGEPLDNFDQTIRFIKLINSKDGLCIGQRHITVSTCGLADKIAALSDAAPQVTLAVSLHAPNDAIRTALMPIAKKYPMDVLLAACRAYADKTKRRVTYEYALIAGVNDALEHAAELAKRLKGTLCHVNLIPVNPVTEKAYRQSGEAVVSRFAAQLKDAGIETTVRRRLGTDIDAACGQLRNRRKDARETGENG